jgi:hypothetical protein
MKKTEVDPMMNMMKTMMQGLITELCQVVPENESLREQANVLAANLVTIPTVKEQLGGFLDTKTIAKILYNLKQSDWDELYGAFESAKKYRRVL